VFLEDLKAKEKSLHCACSNLMRLHDSIDDEHKPAAQKPITSLNCAEDAAGCWEQVPGENDEFRGNAIDLCC